MKASGPLIGVALLACIGRPAVAVDVSALPVAPLASLSLAIEPSGEVDVPVLIAEHPTKLRLDTGDSWSELTETGATALGLPRDHVPYHERFVFFGPGVYQQVTEYAVADSVRFDHFDSPGEKFFIVADNDLPFDIAGKMGADILRRYDVELDLPRAKLNIYPPGQCANIWPAGAATQLAIDVTGRGQIIVNVQLDGKAMQTLLDSGAPTSILNLGAAKDVFGLNEKTPGLKALATRNGYAYLLSYPFRTLVFQGVTIANPDIEIGGATAWRQPLVIGANILRLLHFCIAYDAEKLYVALPVTH